MDDIQVSELQSKLNAINSDLRRLGNLSGEKIKPEKTLASEIWAITGRRLAGDINDLAITLHQNSGTLSAYSSSVNHVTNTLTSFTASFGVGGKIFGGVISVVGGLVNRFLNGTEEVLNARSKLESYGSTVDVLPKNLQDFANATGLYHSKNISEYTKALETLGSASLYVANTTGKGMLEFNNLANVLPATTKAFNKIGVGPTELRGYFAEYIKLESARVFTQYRGADSEQKRAITYTKNLLAMAALTGESTKELQQKYLELRKDVQYNAKLEVMRQNGQEKHAQHMDDVLTLVSTVMGEDAMNAMKDVMVNGNATMDKSKGIIWMSGGKILDLLNRVMTDDSYDPKTALKDMLESYDSTITQLTPQLKFGQSEVLTQLGMSAKLLKARSMIKSGMTIEEMLKNFNETSDAADSLKDTNTAQIFAEGKAGVAADMLADKFSDATIWTFQKLETILKYTVKAFAFGAGLFGKTELSEKLEDIFLEAPKIKERAEYAATNVPIVQHDIRAAEQKVAALTIAKQQKDPAKIIERLSIDRDLQEAKDRLAKLRMQELKLQDTVQQSWKRYNESSQGIVESSGKKSIMDTISQYESNRNYNATAASGDMHKLSQEEHAYATDFLNNLDSKSITEVLAFQKWLTRPGIPSSAIGRYQYLRATLDEKVAAMQKRGLISYSDKFTPETQDKIMAFHLDQLGYEKYVTGKMSKEQFHKNIGNTWYGIGTKEGDIGEDDNALRADGKRRNKAGSGSYAHMSSTLDNIKKFKKGGIATTSDIELHGTEAIIPYSKQIDININMPKLIEIDQKKWQLNMDKIKTSFEDFKLPKPKVMVEKSNIDFTKITDEIDKVISNIDRATNTLDMSNYYLNNAIKSKRY